MLDNHRNVKYNERARISSFRSDSQSKNINDLTGFCLFPILTCPALLLFKSFPIEAKREGRYGSPVSF